MIFSRNKTHRPNPTLIILSLLLILTTLQLELWRRLRFPSGSDQDSYLAAGKEFAEQWVFLWRAPLYSAWMGIFYLLSGKNSQICFFLEKYFSVLLFCLLVAYLGKELFDIQTGLLMGVWVLNCKYFIIEANGSHALVGSLFIASALCLLLQNRHARLPIAIFFLFLATLVRIEMWGVFFFSAIAMSIVTLRQNLKNMAMKSVNFRRGAAYWLSCFAVGIGLTTLFTLRPSFIEPPIPNHAFIQNFAVNYVERKGISDRYPQPWSAVPQIWSEALPGAADALSAARMYPNEIEKHILYNLKLSSKALFANVLAFDNKLLMLAALAVYLGSYILWKRQNDFLEKWKTDFSGTVPILIIWAIAISVIIPMTLVYRAAARYYIPLIPMQMVMVLFAIRAVMNKIPIFFKAPIHSNE